MHKAKKSLGQNFLKSKQALMDIIAAANLNPNDTVLEVGPGRGFLTESLLEKGCRVIAIEKDEILVEFLKEKFSKEIKKGSFELICGDILNFDITTCGLQVGQYKIIANIPYYITGQLLRLFLSGNCQPSKMVLMLQKEVAQRIVAKDGKESILSISVKAYGKPKYISTVDARYFSPQPDVDSAILLIDAISRDFFKTVDEKKFFEIVKKGFSQKRKLLLSNLDIPAEKKEIVAKSCGIDVKERAENLTTEQWRELSKTILI